MRILFAALKYDYNDKTRGHSFEYENFYKSLVCMDGIETVFFDISDFNNVGRRDMNNKKLLELLKIESIDIFFYMPYQDNIYEDVLLEIKNNKNIKSVCWFSDDHWRFDAFSKRMCKYFDFCITTDKNSIEKYYSEGYRNVILSQWGCNNQIYKKLDLPYKYEVTFVGQPHGNRKEIIKKIRDCGIDVRCFGYGWEKNLFKSIWNKMMKVLGIERFSFSLGRITQDEMIRIFNQSKINLNLSNSSNPNYSSQIKGRNFEIPACGSFILTEKVEYLDEYYTNEKEVITYDNFVDLVEKIKYYLANSELREYIADQGYKRTIASHKYEDRFRNIFDTMLQNP